MMIGIAWFVLAFAAGLLAERRHRSGLGWFFIALLLSPLLAFVLLLVLRPGEDKGVVTCPACAEAVKAEAIICKHCGTALPGSAPADAAAAEAVPAPDATPDSAPATARAWERPAVIGALALVALLVSVFVVRELRAPKTLPAAAAAVDPATDVGEACRQARYLLDEHLKPSNGTLTHSSGTAAPAAGACEGLTLEPKWGGWEATATATLGEGEARTAEVVQARLQQPEPGWNLVLCRMTVGRRPVATPGCP